MNFYQIEPKIVDTSCLKYQKFWYLSLIQININQIEPKIADSGRSKYQKLWYLGRDEY